MKRVEIETSVGDEARIHFITLTDKANDQVYVREEYLMLYGLLQSSDSGPEWHYYPLRNVRRYSVRETEK